MKTAVRVVVVLFSVAVLQRGVFSQIHIVGVSVDALLLIAIAAGMTGGPDRGAVVGFAAGLTFDLFVQTPLGLSALTYLIVGYLAGVMQQAVIHSSWWVPMAMSWFSSALAQGIFILMGAMLGQSIPSPQHIIAIVAVVSTFNALAIRPAERLTRWAWNASEIGLVAR